MTDRCQGEIRKENERAEACDTTSKEILVIKATDAAVQEEVMMITSDDTTLAHRAVKGSSGNVFSTAVATVAIAGL